MAEELLLAWIQIYTLSFKKIQSNFIAVLFISFILKGHFPSISSFSPQQLHKFLNANIYSLYHPFWLRCPKDFGK